MSHRVIPVGKINGMRFGQILISALSHAQMEKQNVVDWLFFAENSDIKVLIDNFLAYYEREAFKGEGQDGDI
jgi:hypothetical protein